MKTYNEVLTLLSNKYIPIIQSKKQNYYQEIDTAESLSEEGRDKEANWFYEAGENTYSEIEDLFDEINLEIGYVFTDNDIYNLVSEKCDKELFNQIKKILQLNAFKIENHLSNLK